MEELDVYGWNWRGNAVDMTIFECTVLVGSQGSSGRFTFMWCIF